MLDELADETMIRRKRPPLDTVTDPTELIFRSTFKQQRFGESVSCLRSLPCVAACLVCQALVVAGFGLLLLGNTVSRFKQSPIVTYGCWPEAGCACDGRRSCNLTLQLTEDMEPPVLIMYQLDRFYTSHRRYKPSFSPLQLRGKGQSFSREELEDCYPLIAPPNTSLPPYAPCGLRAATIFDDRVIMLDPNGQPVNLSKDIVPSFPLSERRLRAKFRVFANRSEARVSPLLAHPALANTSLGLVAAAAAAAATAAVEGPQSGADAGDELDPWAAISATAAVAASAEEDTQADLISWLRGSPSPLLRKPLARIDARLPAGRYSLVVRSSFPTELFRGNKARRAAVQQPRRAPKAAHHTPHTTTHTTHHTPPTTHHTPPTTHRTPPTTCYAGAAPRHLGLARCGPVAPRLLLPVPLGGVAPRGRGARAARSQLARRCTVHQHSGPSPP